MKILLSSYNTCCQNKAGGVQTRIRKIYELLKLRGIQVDYFSAFDSDLRNYDVLHVFMLDYETRGLIKCAKRLGLKVILSSIVSISERRKLRILRFLTRLGIPTLYKYNREILNNVDAIIVESQKESEYIQECYNIEASKLFVIPNGIHKSDAKGEGILSIVPNKKFILQVGRFDQNKNQLNVIRAVKGTDINVVFIGGADETLSSEYFNKCKEEAKGFDNITFLGWLPQDSPLFISALRNAHALILPSFFETFGLVALEGAINGAHVCLSNTLPINDYNIFDKSLTFSPSSVSDIHNVLIDVIKRSRSNDVQAKVEEFFSWDRIIDKHLEIYTENEI